MTAKQLSETLVYHNEYTDKIPTLDHLIKKLKKNSTKMGLLIELKVEGGNGEKLAKKIIDVIEKNDYQKQAIYMSLDLDTVQYLQSQRPEWWIGYCIYGSAGDIEGSLWNQGIDFLAIEENRATVSFVEKANRNWVPVYVLVESLLIILIGGEKQSINSKRIIISIIIIMGQDILIVKTRLRSSFFSNSFVRLVKLLGYLKRR